MTQKFTRQFLQEIYDEFQMVLLDESEEPFDLEERFEFNPLVTSTPKKKKNNKPKSNQKRSSHLTMSQFVGHRTQDTQPRKHPHNFNDEHTFIASQVQEDVDLFTPIDTNGKRARASMARKTPGKKVAMFRRVPPRRHRRPCSDICRNLDKIFKEHAMEMEHDDGGTLLKDMIVQIFDESAFEDELARFKISDGSMDAE